MSKIPYTPSELVGMAAEFSRNIEAARPRWAYCFERSTHFSPNRNRVLNLRTVPVCARFLGADATATRFRLGRIMRDGIDAAFAWGEESDKKPYRAGMRPTYGVGPLEPWHIGHLYFVRVKSHPHIVKIGFSRRLHDRFEEISTKNKVELFMHPGGARAGTLADEHWWHRHWASSRISGEWFFDPRTTDRTLPGFLEEQKIAEVSA